MQKKASKQLTWLTGEGHAAKTTTIPDVTGKLVRIDVVISNVTATPTTDIAIKQTDTNGPQLLALSTLAKATHHVKLAESHKATQDADFNPIPLCNTDLFLSVDPSADPGGTAQVLTVDVVLYLEEV
jgi:hypothetical protein